MAARSFDSPLRFGLQEREQLVGSPKLALAKAPWYGRFDGLQFSRWGGGVGTLVRYCRDLAIANGFWMSQIVRNLTDAEDGLFN